MYSSLPSASKLYASSVVRNKAKNATNARKKRRKGKVLSSNPNKDTYSETPTLVSDAENATFMSNLNYDSDTTESVTESIVRSCTGEETSKVNTNENDLLDDHPIGFEQEHCTNDDPSCDDSEKSISKSDKFKLPVNDTELKTEILPELPNTIITSAEIHCIDSEQNDAICSSFESSDEELNFGKSIGELPVIIISSSDSPEFCGDEEVGKYLIHERLTNDAEVNDFIHNKFSSSRYEPYETINEEHESEESFEEKTCGDDVPTIIHPISNDKKLPTPIQTTSSQTINSSNLIVNNNLETEGIDNISVKSDCCSSKNIYNEYSTETVDDSEQHFMIDDSKLNSAEDYSSSLSDSDDVEPERITSPGTSEVSATESSLGENKKIVQEAKSYTYTGSMYYRPISNVPKAAQYIPPYERNMPDVKYVSSCENVITKQRPCIKEYFMNRTQSLPDNLDSKCPKNITFCTMEEYDLKDNFSSNVSVQTSEHRNYELENKYTETVSSAQLVNPPRFITQNDMSQSCVSSTSSLTSGSSGFYSILPVVSTKEARLRSYVVGSVKASGSLLGVEELSRYFPEKKVNIFVGTWNMNGQDAPQCIDDFLLPLGVDYLSDIYAIGVQESSQSRNDWEILMQTTLGPSHVLLTSTSLGVLHLAIFIRRDLIWFCSEPEDDHVTTRPGSMVKTKGAVAISFTFFGTSFLFLNSHLTAHERKLKERLADYEKICNLIDLPKKIQLKPQYQSKDVTSRFDYVFWCGDLNFRVVQDRPSVLSFVEEKLKQTMHTSNYLLQHDQLHKAMNEGTGFHGFQEGVINFVPSYKFDVGTSFFNSTKQRVPSYTDRVLYRSKRNGTACCIHYNVVSDIMTSDHKPVFAVFEVNIKPGRDNIPLAAGLFKREVYLEALSRRAKALEISSNHGSSKVCSVM